MSIVGLALTSGLALVVGCSQSNPSPEQIRQDAAKATSAAIRDTKAAVKGVEDGVKQQHHDGSADHHDGNVDINHASADQLETLPGVDAARARRIIANRPYRDSDELLKRHVVTATEYDRISGQIEAD